MIKVQKEMHTDCGKKTISTRINRKAIDIYEIGVPALFGFTVAKIVCSKGFHHLSNCIYGAIFLGIFLRVVDFYTQIKQINQSIQRLQINLL